MSTPDYTNPDNMSEAQLLEWAKYNFRVWDESNTNQSAWYILFMWAYRKEIGE